LKNEENSTSVSITSQRDEDSQKKYEPTIQKLEKETRDHIRIEQQFKLYIEYLHDRIEKLEAKEKLLKEDIKAKVDACNQLKEKLIKCNEKYNNLKLSMKKLTPPVEMGVDKMHTKFNISIDDKPNRTWSEYYHIRKPSEVFISVYPSINVRKILRLRMY